MVKKCPLFLTWETTRFITVFQPRARAAGARRSAAVPRGTVMLEELKDALRSVFSFIQLGPQNKTQLLGNYASGGKDYKNGRIFSLGFCIRTIVSPEACQGW